MYKVGTIVSTHGIKGEVKVKSDTDFNRFLKGSILYLKMENKYIEIKINSHRVHKNMDLITFNDFNNINMVLEYINLELYSKHLAEDLEEDEYFVENLVGLKVVNIDGSNLGTVKDILEVPQGHILEIENNGKISMIPFVNEFIKEVNDEEIIVETIEGLV